MNKNIKLKIPVTRNIILESFPLTETSSNNLHLVYGKWEDMDKHVVFISHTDRLDEKILEDFRSLETLKNETEHFVYDENLDRKFIPLLVKTEFDERFLEIGSINHEMNEYIINQLEWGDEPGDYKLIYVDDFTFVPRQEDMSYISTKVKGTISEEIFDISLFKNCKSDKVVVDWNNPFSMPGMDICYSYEIEFDSKHYEIYQFDDQEKALKEYLQYLEEDE